MFDWRWHLSDIRQDKPVKVFSVFSGIGGSSLGYKRAGFEVVGNVELDGKANKLYCANLHPKYNYQMDVRDFNEFENLPEELYRLDILDGSPPCTSFTWIGKRNKYWGVERQFSEGQEKQRLDLLSLEFLETVARLKPKIVILENVPAIICGLARGYVNEILNRFIELGYAVQMFLLNACFMDVPQDRRRIFFIANNQGYPRLKLRFESEPISFGEVREAAGIPVRAGTKEYERLQKMLPCDRSIDAITFREEGVLKGYCRKIIHDWEVCQTLTKSEFYRGYDKKRLTLGDRRNVSTFPQDYNFLGYKDIQGRLIGYAVPPNMMANLALEIYRQWLASRMSIAEVEV